MPETGTAATEIRADRAMLTSLVSQYELTEAKAVYHRRCAEEGEAAAAGLAATHAFLSQHMGKSLAELAVLAESELRLAETAATEARAVAEQAAEEARDLLGHKRVLKRELERMRAELAASGDAGTGEEDSGPESSPEPGRAPNA